MPVVTGATPLTLVEAVALDLETTDLDPARARVIEIGVVAASAAATAAPARPAPIGEKRGDAARGGGAADVLLDLVVDPGVPIPAGSTRIHGIDDARVRGAPAFAAAAPRLAALVEGRVVVGHSVGYDLAVLAEEHRRAGLRFARPRTLCVRLLAVIARADLPDYSLDALAAWLGVAVEGRHSAVGDARAAAAIFTKLLPHLAAKGVRSLGEAERAILAIAEARLQVENAGWAEPAAPGAGARPPVDPAPYRYRVGALMAAEPVAVAPATPLRAAIRLMAERRISSLLVADPAGDPAASPAPAADAGGTGEAAAAAIVPVKGRPLAELAIVTERDVLRRIAAEDVAALERPVGSVASRPLAAIRAEAFAYRAIGRMKRLRLRHLAVQDGAGRLAGVISARDLLRLRGEAAVGLDDAIEGAADAAGLAAAWATLPAVAGALAADEIEAPTVAEIVSEELCAMTRRAAVLAEAGMREGGHGGPPCGYAVMVLGSGGRGESLLAADQDNAVVFETGEPDGAEDRWFAAFGAALADGLAAGGVPLCKGGVMARNPDFRGSLATWRARADGWVRRQRPEDLLNVDIFFDLRPVHGDLGIAAEVLDHARAAAHAAPDFAKALGEQVVAGNPFTLLGGLRLEDGRIDLKRHGLFPVVTLARTLAIRHDVRAGSTRARLEGLIARGIGGEADLRALAAAHALFTRLLLAQQSRDLDAGLPAGNRLDPSTVTSADRAALRDALKRVQAVPSLLRDLMFVGG